MLIINFLIYCIMSDNNVVPPFFLFLCIIQSLLYIFYGPLKKDMLCKVHFPHTLFSMKCKKKLESLESFLCIGILHMCVKAHISSFPNFCVFYFIYEPSLTSVLLLGVAEGFGKLVIVGWEGGMNESPESKKVA